MRTRIWLLVGVSLFPVFGNGQDGAVVNPTAAVTAYGTQGNVAFNRTLHDAEMQRAVQEARQMNALREAMAAQATARYEMKITTAEQFLAANRPPMPPPSEERKEPTPGSAYVPDFESGAINNDATSTTRATVMAPVEEPRKKAGIFDFLKRKDRVVESGDIANPYVESDIPPADYGPAPSLDEVPGDSEIPVETVSNMEVAMPEREKPNLLSRLFGQDRGEAGDSMPTAPPETANVPETPAPELPPAPVASNEIPEAPAMDEPTAPVVAPPAPPESPPAPAPIFVNRNAAGSGGTSATINSDVQADVSGVKVTLFSGTKVSVIERQGSVARIRLPDGRVGFVPNGKLAY